MIDGERWSLDLYWFPLGAGGSVVHASGRTYEETTAFLHRRRVQDPDQSALVAHTPDGPVVIEVAPVPADPERAPRGVVAEGPV